MRGQSSRATHRQPAQIVLSRRADVVAAVHERILANTDEERFDGAQSCLCRAGWSDWCTPSAVFQLSQ